MNVYKNYFKEFHPVVTFLYFIAVIVLTITFTHPAFLLVGIAVCVLYLLLLFGVKSLLKNLIFSLPLIVFIVIINPLFNHQGATPILYINDQPITEEAILYGLFTGLLILCLLFWFRSMGTVIDSYRFLYLFGGIIPTIALMASMTIRFIPYFRRKLDEIQKTGHAIGISTKHGKLKRRIHAGNKILSTLISTSLENSIDTADSMRARGYHLKHKTHYHTYRFTLKDIGLSLIVFVFSVVFIIIYSDGTFQFSYYPVLTPFYLNQTSILTLVSYSIFLGLPVIYNGLEALKWHLLISKN